MNRELREWSRGAMSHFKTPVAPEFLERTSRLACACRSEEGSGMDSEGY